MAYYKNLAAEKARHQVTNKEIGEKIGRSEETVGKKTEGLIDFKVAEAKAIRENFFPECTLDYLFECD